MSANLSEMTNFQIWNAARGIATKSLSAVESAQEDVNLSGENSDSDEPTTHFNAVYWMSVDLESLRESYDKLASEEDLWPFETFEDYLASVDDVGVHRIQDDYPDLHQDFSKSVSDRLQEIKKGDFDPSTRRPPELVFKIPGQSDQSDQESSVDVETTPNNTAKDTSDGVDESKNGSQTSSEVEVSENNSETRVDESSESGSGDTQTDADSGEDAASASGDLNPVDDTSDSDESDSEATEGDGEPSTTSGNSTNEDVDGFAQSNVDDQDGSSSSADESDNTESQLNDEISADIDNPEVESVSVDLYRCFISREDISFSEISSQYDQDFPPRSIVLTEVMNASGAGRSQRLESIAEWVAEWFDKPDVVQELEKYAYRPMGSRIGS